MLQEGQIDDVGEVMLMPTMVTIDMSVISKSKITRCFVLVSLSRSLFLTLCASLAHGL